MAYDAWDGYDVYFGGGTKGAPGNQTWSFADGRWTNLTPRLAGSPPARIGAAMDYDALYNVVLLFGGCSVAACPDNSTWYYTASLGWTNLTPRLTSAPPGLQYASLGFAADPLDNYSVLFGGCLDSACNRMSNTTYGFSGSGWVPIPSAGQPPARWGASMAFDPDLGALVLTDGCAGPTSCGTGSFWTYSEFAWTNRTLAWGSSTSPPERALSVFTWDEAHRRLVYFGGTDGHSDYSDTWSLSCGAPGCAWSNLTELGGSAPALVDAAAPAVSNASVGVVLFGGRFAPNAGGGSGGEGLSNGTFVFEPLLSAEPLVPVLAAVGSYVAVQSNPAGGAVVPGGTPIYNATWWYGTARFFGVAAAVVFPSPGHYTLGLDLQDAAGVDVLGRFAIEVTGATVAVEGTNVSDAGVAVNLSVSAISGGTPPYQYNWTFGDGGIAAGSAVAHAWSIPGVYDVDVRVTDALGAVSWAYARETVVPFPALSLSASQLSVDAGIAVTFTSNISGGVAPFTVRWTLQDGTNVAAPVLVHAFRAAGASTVSAAATDALGVTARSTIFVTVDPPLAVSPTAMPNPSAPNATTWLDASVTGGSGVYTIRWTLGDGVGATGERIAHTYSSTGLYEVRVSVNDSLGGQATGEVTVVVVAAGGSSSLGTGGDFALWWGVLLAVGVIAVGVVVVWDRSRRRPRR